MNNWPWGMLDPFGYDMIMVDFPWTYKIWSSKGDKKSPQAKYECMSFEDICAMPVHWLAKPDSVCWLWATNPMLDKAFIVMEAIGFTFKTTGTWIKTTKHGKLGFGTGYILRSANEPFLIGTRGKPKFARNVRSALYGHARESGRKPDEAYEYAERLLPGATARADLFSREDRPGWEAWGWETGKFNAENRQAKT